MAREIFETNGIVVTYESNVEGVLEALRNANARGLAMIGETAVRYAQELCPVGESIPHLRDTITYEVDERDNSVVIGTATEYGKYVEFGTGIYAEEGGRQTPWSYQDTHGQWHYTHGQKPQPFIRPAATEHGQEYSGILRESLENA